MRYHQKNIIKVMILLPLLVVSTLQTAHAFPDGFPYVRKHMRKKVGKMLDNINKMGGSSPACSTILCLAPYVGMGTSGGPACVGPNQIYFNIRVFDPWSGYDADLTKAVRGAYLKTCPDTENAALARSENDAVGTWFSGQ